MNKGELNNIALSLSQITEAFAKAKTMRDRLTRLELGTLLESCIQSQDLVHEIYLKNTGIAPYNLVWYPGNTVTFQEIEQRIDGLDEHIEKLQKIQSDSYHLTKWLKKLLKRLGNLVATIKCYIAKIDTTQDDAEPLAGQTIDHERDPIDDAFCKVTRKLMDAQTSVFDAQSVVIECLENAIKIKPNSILEPDAATVVDFTHRCFSSEMSSLDIGETITNTAARSRSVLGLIRSSLEKGEGSFDRDGLFYPLQEVSMQVRDMAAVIEIFEKNQKPIDEKFIDCLPYYAIDLTIFPFLQEICQRALGRLNKIMTLLAENEGRRLVPERICQVIDRVEMEIIRIDQAVPILCEISAAAEQATKPKNQKRCA